MVNETLCGAADRYGQRGFIGSREVGKASSRGPGRALSGVIDPEPAGHHTPPMSTSLNIVQPVLPPGPAADDRPVLSVVLPMYYEHGNMHRFFPRLTA